MSILTSTSSSPKEEQEQFVESSSQKVEVYFRLSNKQSFKTKISSHTSSTEIYKTAQKETGFDLKEIYLFTNGNQIPRLENEIETEVTLKEKDIIHIHQSRNFTKNKIMIFIRMFECDIMEKEVISMFVDTCKKLQDELCEFLNGETEVALIQSGRKLDVTKTFTEQFIEDGSTIIATIFMEKEKISQRIASRMTKESSLEESVKKEKEEIKKEMPVGSSMYKKSITWSDAENERLGNFKKKLKPSIYKTMSITEKETIWESDSSSDLAQKRSLVKKLAIRKQSKNEELTIVNDSPKVEKEHEIVVEENSFHSSPSQSQLTIEDKMDIRAQLKKLLFSEVDDDNEEFEFEGLQSPIMNTSKDYFEEVEEFEVNPNGFSETETVLKSIDLGAPINLRESIGKSRGTFIPLIPTRDLEIDDDEEEENEDLN